MRQNIAPCVAQHLPDKAKPGNIIPATAWFDAAAAHLTSARVILATDAGGAYMLGWTAMHKTAKGLAASGGVRLEGETHGKIVDFLTCVFDGLGNRDKGLVRLTSTGRNNLAYDDPRVVDQRICLDVLDLAERMLEAARNGTAPAASNSPKRIPPPPGR